MSDTNEKKCTERATIMLPWASKMINCCNVHANKLCAIAEELERPLTAYRIGAKINKECECMGELTEQEKQLNKTFLIQ